MALCLLGRIRQQLEPGDQDDLDDLLDDPAYSSRVIARALRSEGHQVSHSCVYSHRVGDCRCAQHQSDSETPATGLKAAAIAHKNCA